MLPLSAVSATASHLGLQLRAHPHAKRCTLWVPDACAITRADNRQRVQLVAAISVAHARAVRVSERGTHFGPIICAEHAPDHTAAIDGPDRLANRHAECRTVWVSVAYAVSWADKRCKVQVAAALALLSSNITLAILFC